MIRRLARVMSPVRWLALAMTGVLLLTTTACGSGGDSDDNQLLVRLALIAEGYDAPLFYAHKLGYFEQAGLDVRIEESTGSSTTTKLVGNKSADIGFADLATAAKGVAQGVPIKAIGAVFQSTPLSTIFIEGRGINTPQDLRGKNVGEQPGSATAQYFPAFLSAVGLQPGDVANVNIEAGAREQLLLSGRIDAFNSYDIENVPILEVGHNVDARAFSWRDHGLHMLGLGIVVNNATLEENPELLRKFLDAYARGYEAAVRDPRAAAQSILDKFERAGGGSVEVLERQWVLSQALQYSPETEGHPLLWMSPDAWQATLETNKRFAGIESDKPATDYYTNDLVPNIPKPTPGS